MKKFHKVCVLILCVFIFTGCGQETETYLEETGSEAFPETETETVRAAEETSTGRTDAEPVMVYVCGEVVNPGVYKLKSGMRICDAVEAAGGLTKKASRDYWNLAEELTDGQMLFFPTEEEAKKRKESAGETGAAAEAETDGKVNINTADASKLQTIPGIGQTRAEAIIAYREENGNFKSIEDIMKVSGIKNGLFEKMKDYITVG